MNKIKCKVCGKSPTKESIYMSDCWDYELCPVHMSRLSMKKTEELIITQPIDSEINIIRVNPVDFYFNKFVAKELIKI